MIGRCTLIAIIFFAVSTSPVFSTTVIEESLENIAKRCDLIVYGKVTRIGESINYAKHGLASATIEVNKVIKGTISDRVITIDGCTSSSRNFIILSGLAELNLGDEVILCLIYRKGAYEVAGACQGKLDVVSGIVQHSGVSLNNFINEP